MKLETPVGGGIAGDFYLVSFSFSLSELSNFSTINMHVFDTINNSMGKLEQRAQENFILPCPPLQDTLIPISDMILTLKDRCI